MKNCPNCGALISDGQSSCSICNTPIINDNNQNNETNNSSQPDLFINSLTPEQAPVEHVYQPLQNEEEKINNTVETNKEEVQPTTTNNGINKTTDEEKKNVMGNILKEREEKEANKPKKDDSIKAAILSILVVIVIVVGGYYAVSLGFNKINDGQDNIMNQVVDQANNYTTIVKDYMRKYDYKERRINLNGYYAKSRTFNFYTLPVTGKCVFNEGKWTGADEDEVSCQKFFGDINDNYCQAVPCSVPTSAEIYIKETYETTEVNGNEETITTGTILDGTVLVYDDVKCSLSGGKYTCEYIEKQDN